jgi:hypothetical protein
MATRSSGSSRGASAEAAARRWLSPRQRQLVVAATATLGVVAAYRLYRSERLKATHAALQTAADTLGRYNAAAASASDMVALLAHDLRAFLASDGDEVPRSLRQLAKLARCGDVQETISAFVASSIRGAMSSAATGSSSSSGDSSEPSVVDRVIEAVLSERGQSLVGLAVKAAACQSTEVFCTAVRQGLEAALQAVSAQQQQQQQPLASPSGLSPASPGAYYSAASSPLPSPQRYYRGASPLPMQHVYTSSSSGSGGAHYTATVSAGGGFSSISSSGLHPVLGAALSLLSSPQLLGAVDGLVSTCVGSTVGACISRAGSSTDLLSGALHTLSQPANKSLVVEIMSQVSAVFCREMAAACVAPAAVVGSRPTSRLSDSPPGLLEHHQHVLLQERLAAAAAASPVSMALAPPAAAAVPLSSPVRLPGAHDMLHHSVSESSALCDAAGGASVGADAAGACDDPAAAAALVGAADGVASEPSSPQSGPSTPEPSVAAAEAAAGPSAWQQQQPHSSYSSFAGSAVAGLILRRPSISGMSWSAAAEARGGGVTGRMEGSAAQGAGAVQYASCGGGSGGPVLVDPSALGPLSTVVTLFVQAARFQEFRSLMIDVSRSSTREFVLSLLPSGWSGAVRSGRGSNSRSGSRSNEVAAAALTAALYRVYTAVSVLLFLMVYALGPKTLLLEPGAAV